MKLTIFLNIYFFRPFSYKMNVSPLEIQEELITSSFCKILGWFIIGDILDDTAIFANSSKREPPCSCYKHTSCCCCWKKEGFDCRENLSTCNSSWGTVLSFRLLLSWRCVFDNKFTPFISGSGFGCNVMDSYFSLLNLLFAENCHISIFTTFEKQSMINRLSNPINRNRSAAKISKVMSITTQRLILLLNQALTGVWTMVVKIFIFHGGFM